jgi:hypothetical protein
MTHLRAVALLQTLHAHFGVNAQINEAVEFELREGIDEPGVPVSVARELDVAEET